VLELAKKRREERKKDPEFIKERNRKRVEWSKTPAGIESSKRAYAKYVSKPGIREKRRKMVKDWWNTPKGRFQKYRINAIKRGIDFNLTLDEFSALWKKPCDYCGAEIEFIGVDRIDPKGIYEPGNITPCCKFCNLSKRDMTAEEYKQHLERIHQFYLKKDVI
jgi:hypothetical protein